MRIQPWILSSSARNAEQPWSSSKGAWRMGRCSSGMRVREKNAQGSGWRRRRRACAASDDGLPLSLGHPRSMGGLVGWHHQGRRPWRWLLRAAIETIAKLHLTMPPRNVDGSDDVGTEGDLSSLIVRDGHGLSRTTGTRPSVFHIGSPARDARPAKVAHIHHTCLSA